MAGMSEDERVKSILDKMNDPQWQDKHLCNMKDHKDKSRVRAYLRAYAIWNTSDMKHETHICFKCSKIKNRLDFIPGERHYEPAVNCATCRIAASKYEKDGKRAIVNEKRKTSSEYDPNTKSQRSRARKRGENEEEFLRKNAEYAREYRKKKKLATVEATPISDPIYTPLQKEVYYRECAMRKDIPISISSDIFHAIFKSSCFYCGDDPTTEKLMGVDRLSSFHGYCMGNVVPCCSMCNMMKGSFDPITFIEKAMEISFAHNHCDRVVCDDVVNASSTTYNKYKERASRKQISFTLTSKEFDDIISKPCYYCFATDHIGLDRIDPSKGYDANNIYPACTTCNYMKRDYPLLEFYTKCDKIAENMNDIPYDDWFDIIPRCRDNIMNVETYSLFSDDMVFHEDFIKYCFALPTHHITYMCSFASCSKMIISGSICDGCADKKKKHSEKNALYMGDRKKCSAVTKTGKPCNFYALSNDELCARHKDPDAYQKKQMSDDKRCIAAVSNRYTQCTKMSIHDSLFCAYHKDKDVITFPQHNATNDEKQQHNIMIHDKYNVWLKDVNQCQAFFAVLQQQCTKKCAFGFDVCSKHLRFSGVDDKKYECIEYQKNRNRKKAATFRNKH